MSASSSDRGGFAVCRVKAVSGEASHKPSPRKRQKALGLDDADTKGFLGFGFKNKNALDLSGATIFSGTPY